MVVLVVGCARGPGTSAPVQPAPAVTADSNAPVGGRDDPPPERPDPATAQRKPASTPLTDAELAAVEIGSICPFGNPVAISTDELADPSNPDTASQDHLDVAAAAQVLRRQGYAIVKLTRCAITAEEFASAVDDAGMGGLAKLLGGSGSAQITTVNGESAAGQASLHFSVSSKSCWPATPRIQQDRFTGSALWQHDRREMGAWCFNYETVDIGLECGAALLDTLVGSVRHPSKTG